MRKWLWIGCLLLLLMSAGVTTGMEAETGILGNYIKEGLGNNLLLKQEAFSLSKSLQALKEVRGMFFPSISIEARYSRAGGGRNIEFPVGDLINPIHSTLNQLLAGMGQAPVFPGDLQNEVIPFLRKREHETKLRVVQPVFQPTLYYNYRIQKRVKNLQQAKLNAFKRQLVLDIKKAYFNYLKTLKVKELLAGTRLLLEENLRISRSLFKNHKKTEEVVFRSKAELSKLEQQIAETEKGSRMAAAYFNFLLNRPLDTPIKIEEHFQSLFPHDKKIDLEHLERHALGHREELRQLFNAIDAGREAINLYKSNALPTITAVIDYGFQGEKYRFTGSHDYWMASLVMSWNLFKGGSDRAKMEQTVLEKKRLEAQFDELENKIRLQVREAYHDLLTARKTVVFTRENLHSWKETYHIVSKKYEQGMVPQIEHIKARNDFTSAAVNNIIARFDYHIKEARLEQASALL
ncbi:MAG: TolC family protein [bacterium]|nr:TolC family protein [bacterium]